MVYSIVLVWESEVPELVAFVVLSLLVLEVFVPMVLDSEWFVPVWSESELLHPLLFPSWPLLVVELLLPPVLVPCDVLVEEPPFFPSVWVMLSEVPSDFVVDPEEPSVQLVPLVLDSEELVLVPLPVCILILDVGESQS